MLFRTLREARGAAAQISAADRSYLRCSLLDAASASLRGDEESVSFPSACSLESHIVCIKLIGRIVGFLREADADMDRIEEDAASRLQLHRTDFRRLDILSRGKALTAGQLGAAAGLTTGATTALLDRLEARGYLRRVRDTHDRRRVLIEVTRSAKKAVAPVFKPLIALSMKQFSAFTPDELEVVLRFAECNRRLIAECLDRGDRRS